MRRAFAVAVLVLAAGCVSVRDPSPRPTRVAAAHAPRPKAVEPKVPVRRRLGAQVERPRYSVLGCIRSPEVDAWERRLAREEAQWRKMIESSRRGGPHYRTIKRIVKEEGLPPGLALLPAIESGYRRDARGPTGARGLWQFGASTARNYGLVVNDRRDDRTNVERSTRAALRLLRDLRERYGSWPLALAAYNAGEGRVQRALDDESGDTFWRLAKAHRLPPITRKYVPKFLALVRVIDDVDACPAVTVPSAVVATAD